MNQSGKQKVYTCRVIKEPHINDINDSSTKSLEGEVRGTPPKSIGGPFLPQQFQYESLFPDLCFFHRSAAPVQTCSLHTHTAGPLKLLVHFAFFSAKFSLATIFSSSFSQWQEVNSLNSSNGRALLDFANIQYHLFSDCQLCFFGLKWRGTVSRGRKKKWSLTHHVSVCVSAFMSSCSLTQTGADDGGRGSKECWLRQEAGTAANLHNPAVAAAPRPLNYILVKDGPSPVIPASVIPPLASNHHHHHTHIHTHRRSSFCHFLPEIRDFFFFNMVHPLTIGMWPFIHWPVASRWAPLAHCRASTFTAACLPALLRQWSATEFQDSLAAHLLIEVATDVQPCCQDWNLILPLSN